MYTLLLALDNELRNLSSFERPLTPWWWRRQFIAAAPIAIYRNGSRPVVNVEIISGGGAGLFFASLACVTRNTTINPWGLGDTNDLQSGLEVGQGGGGHRGGGGEVGLLLFILPRCKHGSRNKDECDGCYCANCRCANKIEMPPSTISGGTTL